MTDPPTDLAIIHPDTGELLEHLDQQPAETLADALNAVQERLQEATRLKAMGQTLETELRRRLELRGRRIDTFGNYEVEAVKPVSEAVWDADEVEGLLREYVDDGVLGAGELTEVVRHEATVNRTEINKVLGRLAGTHRDVLERLRTWRTKGQPRVKVTKSVELPSPAPPVFDPEWRDPDRNRYWGD